MPPGTEAKQTNAEIPPSRLPSPPRFLWEKNHTKHKNRTRSFTALSEWQDDAMQQTCPPALGLAPEGFCNRPYLHPAFSANTGSDSSSSPASRHRVSLLYKPWWGGGGAAFLLCKANQERPPLPATPKVLAAPATPTWRRRTREALQD